MFIASHPMVVLTNLHHTSIFCTTTISAALLSADFDKLKIYAFELKDLVASEKQVNQVICPGHVSFYNMQLIFLFSCFIGLHQKGGLTRVG